MPYPFYRHLKMVVLAAVAITLAAPAALRAQHVLTPREWAEDLDALVKTVVTKHRCPFDHVSREEFDKAAAALRERLPSLRDHEVMVGLARLVAMLRDGHSRLLLPVDPGDEAEDRAVTPAARVALACHALPVKFYLYKDGLRIISTAPEQRALLGAKVVSIGRLSADEALAAVRPVISYDSEMWVKRVVPDLLRIPEVLQACGVSEGLETVPLEIERGGRRETLSLEPLPRGRQPEWVSWTSFPGGVKPLYLRQPATPFWFEYLEGQRLLYVQINAIQDAKDERLAAFAGRLGSFIEDRDVDKLVLDLRLNGGGNNYLNRGLVLALSGSHKVNRYGHLFTIIGRATFSAAISLVSALEQWTETIFVGEPTGNSPSQFGDSRKYDLPRSGLGVRLSSVYWRDWSSNEKRPWVPAGLKAEPTWSEYAAGRDPALEAVLAYTPPDTLLGRLEERDRWGGLDSAFTFYYHVRNSPESASVRTEAALIGYAEYLAAGGREGDARSVFGYCLEEYPDSFGALLGLGKSYTRAGDAKNAVAAFEKALALKPGNEEAGEWLKKAKALPPAKK